MKKKILLLSLIFVLLLSPVNVFADTPGNSDVPNNDIPNPGTGFKEDAAVISAIVLFGGATILIKLSHSKKKLAKI